MKKQHLISLLAVFVLSGCNILPQPARNSKQSSLDEEPEVSSTYSVPEISSSKEESSQRQSSRPNSSSSSSGSSRSSSSPSSSSSSNTHVHSYVEISHTQPTCEEPGRITYECPICGARNVVIAESAFGHDYIELFDRADEGTPKTLYMQCRTCNDGALRWDATEYDTSLTSGTVNTGTDGFSGVRFGAIQYANDSTDPGTHIFYKIYSPVACYNAGLSFYIQVHRSSYNYPIFNNAENEVNYGYEYNENGELVKSTKRYGLRVNNQQIELGEDVAEGDGPDAGTIGWFAWPVNFDIHEGYNTIEIYGLGGYRPVMQAFQITGFGPSLFKDNPNPVPVNLNDFTTPNCDINFDAVTDNCMVSPRVKNYVDAMKEQETTLEKPYHFSSLYGPDDYAYIASQRDQNDGVIYDDVDKGGVDVCDYLNRNDYLGRLENYPIQVSWDRGNLSYNSANLIYWSKSDYSDIKSVIVGANQTSANLANLLRATTYRAQLITESGQVSQGFEFTTGDYPRVISMGDIRNVRDIGGYMTSYGVRTNQGLLYRGFYIEDQNGGHGINYTEEAGRVNDEVMQIGLELDLQKASEINNRTTSCLNGAEYRCLTLISYENFLTEASYNNLPEIFSIIANADREHVYFHCWGGADRTGTLAFFINAICGVSYTDLIIDFELSTETNNKRCHMHNSSSAHFPRFLNAFINEWEGYNTGQTINENCERWLVDVAHVNPQDILKIRQMMIPGYYDGMPQNIPSYTPVGIWIDDDLAHWQLANENSNVKVNWARHSGNPCPVCGYEDANSPTEDVNNYLDPLPISWAQGEIQYNSDGLGYYPLIDTSSDRVGVSIPIVNYSPDSTGTFNSGKIDPGNVDDTYMTYRIKAPRAGAYQMVMRGRVSQMGYTLTQRRLRVMLNGESIDVYGDREPNLVNDNYNDFVVAPLIWLTGNEDVIRLECQSYRIIFEMESSIIFAEH